LSRKTLKIKFSGESLMIKHSDLDNLTADLARKAGAKIILNRKVSESDLNAFQQSFDRIIGCDGADSFVRKNLGLPSPDLRLAIQGFFSGTVPVKLDCVETWPTQSGFLWKIPRQGEIEYGIIEKPKKAKKFFEEFLRKNNLKLERIDSALVPEGLIIPKNDKITLCGDAAGLAKPWSGGGVIWGLTAANFLLKDFPDFLKYRKAARKFFLPEIIFSKTIKKMVYLFGFKFPWLLPKEVNMGGDFLLF
jgi:flavin-dependent dehydrogenase